MEAKIDIKAEELVVVLEWNQVGSVGVITVGGEWALGFI